MIRLLRSSALLAVVPFLAIFALAFHSLFFVISFVCSLAGLEIVWPHTPLAELEPESYPISPVDLSSN